jgi:hypothetical protein
MGLGIVSPTFGITAGAAGAPGAGPIVVGPPHVGQPPLQSSQHGWQQSL